jgi:hypothetical protein
MELIHKESKFQVKTLLEVAGFLVWLYIAV